MNKNPRKSKCLHQVDQKKTIDLLNPPLPKEGRETVQAIYNEHVEELLIPSRKPRDVPVVFNKTDFQRLKQKAQVQTMKEKLAIIKEAEEKKRMEENECQLRKKQLQKAQQEQLLKSGTKLTTLEHDTQKKTEYLLKRAFELRQEQEDEVKHANQLILASKCLAIRSAQLAEKKLVVREVADEEQRLDNMMEEHRRRALQKEENQRKEQKKTKHRFVNEMMQQIRDREIEKLQEAERVEEEARLQNRALIQMQREDEAKRVARLKNQQQMRTELKRANEDIARYKQLEQEEQRISDLRVQEFMRQKAAREAAHEASLEEARIAKEKEVAHLRAMQERQQDQQAIRDEMNALRVQEEVEREWRRKEKAVVEKKRNDEEQLRIARERQIEDIRRKQAIELEREKLDFDRVVLVQKMLQQKEVEKQAKRKENNLKHRQEILKQVNEKEREKIDNRKEKFEEGKAIRAEKEIRERNIQQTLKNKMARLRSNNVPESVVKDIERQLKLTSN